MVPAALARFGFLLRVNHIKITFFPGQLGQVGIAVGRHGPYARPAERESSSPPRGIAPSSHCVQALGQLGLDRSASIGAGSCSTAVGFECHSILTARCKLGSIAAVLSPK